MKTTSLSTQQQSCWTRLKSYEESPGPFSEAAEATWLSSSEHPISLTLHIFHAA